MTRHVGGPRPNSRRATEGGRQLAVGECIAIARYGPHYIDDESVDLDDLLVFIDRIGVCTTCGWPVHTHEAPPETLQVLHVCPQHTR